MVLDLLATSKFAHSPSTQHLVVETAINYARNEEDILLVCKWFDGVACDRDGTPFE